MEISERAAALHRESIVIDGHCDILIPVSDGKMKLDQRVALPDSEGWEPPLGFDIGPFALFGMSAHTVWFGCMGQYDLRRWREGGITSQLCAVYLDDEQLNSPLHRGLEMTWNLHHEVERLDDLVLATSVAEIRQAKQNSRVALVFSFEGCEALGADPRFLDLYYKLGLRVASLTHTRRNIYADGCWAADDQGGLTAAGKALVDRMVELDIVVDLVHIGERGYWEILDRVDRPVILSHTTPTMFPNSDPESRLGGGTLPRTRLELPRDRKMLEALAENGGVLGLIHITHRNLSEVVDDIETALDVMGPDHIGMGSDHYGIELAPEGLEHIGKVPAITEELVRRGHSDDTIRKFLGENYLRVFEEVWGQ